MIEFTRGGHFLIPGPGAALGKGDRVSFVGASAALERLRSLLGGGW